MTLNNQIQSQLLYVDLHLAADIFFTGLRNQVDGKGEKAKDRPIEFGAILRWFFK